MMRPKTTLALAFFILLLPSLACRQFGGGDASSQAGSFPIDPVFSDFYESLGGRQVLGQAISPAFQNGGKEYQYTLAALMVYDALALSAEQFQLAPLGLDMGIADLPVPPPVQPDTLYVNGHIVFEDFVPLYNQLSGINIAGKPLTEVRHNLVKRRFEQYFENVGIYRLEGAPVDEAKLLAYGDWKCGASCPFTPSPSTVVELPTRSAAPFIQKVARLGSGFSGFALTGPYVAQDGSLEQIYENLVMVFTPESPDQVALRPIPAQLGIRPDPMEAALSDPGFYFFPIGVNRGYNVPVTFMEYISRHGGEEVSGVPVTRLASMGNGVYRQCFTNLCLEERPEQPESQRVQPMPLGYTYRALYYQPDPSPEGALSLGISLQTWETASPVSPEQGQKIGVRVFDYSLPHRNVVPALTLTLPGGVQKTYNMPLTDQQGEAWIQLGPLPVEDGSLVSYRVCVGPKQQQTVCVHDSFIAWGTDWRQTSGKLYLPLIHKLYFEDIYKRCFLPFVFK